FNNFPHTSYFTFQPSNVLVRHCWSADRRLFPFDDPDVRAFSDDDRPRRDCSNDLEVNGFGKCGHTHNAARDNWDAHQIFKHAVWRDRRWRSAYPQWCEANSHGLFMLNRSNRYLLLQSHTAVTSTRAVDLDRA